MAASGLLDQYLKRGMDDVIQRSIVKKTFEADIREKLKLEGLVVKFEAAIQAHDAEVAAAQAALAAPAFGIPLATVPADMDASFSRDTPSPQTEGNTVANSQLEAVDDMTSRCTIRIANSSRSISK